MVEVDITRKNCVTVAKPIYKKNIRERLTGNRPSPNHRHTVTWIRRARGVDGENGEVMPKDVGLPRLAA